MKYDKEIKSASQILETYFSGILSGKMEEYSALDKGWHKILKSIPKDGERLASHTSIKEIKNGCMYIETDHSGWIQLLQLHKRKILYALKKEFSSINIKEFLYTVKEK